MEINTIKKKWMTRSEVKSYLGCNDEFLKRMRSKAQVSYSKVGRTIFYSVESIERLLTRNRQA